MDKRKYLLGIDPSFKNFGASIYSLETKKIIALKTDGYTEMVTWIGKNVKLSECYAVIEAPHLDSNIFGMYAMVKAEIEDVMRYQLWRASKMGLPKNWVSKILLGSGVTKSKCNTSTYEKKMSDIQSKFGIAMRVARSVGENSAAGKLIIKQLSEAGVPCVEIAPSKRDSIANIKKKLQSKIGIKGANMQLIKLNQFKMPTKSTAAEFKEWTSYEGSTNEHNRDAATLIFGKTAKWVEMKLHEQGYYQTLTTPKSYPKQSNNAEYVIDRKSVSL